MMRVEVVHALREAQWRIELELEEGATVLDAVTRSSVLERLPGVNASSLVLGIFGRVVPHDTPLADGDRVELYRPLKVDPSMVRRPRLKRRRERRG